MLSKLFLGCVLKFQGIAPHGDGRPAILSQARFGRSFERIRAHGGRHGARRNYGWREAAAMSRRPPRPRGGRLGVAHGRRSTVRHDQDAGSAEGGHVVSAERVGMVRISGKK